MNEMYKVHLKCFGIQDLGHTILESVLSSLLYIVVGGYNENYSHSGMLRNPARLIINSEDLG